jgi:hypothetical protein
MNINKHKLYIVAALTVLFIVAAGLDWVDASVAYGWVAIALAYILGNSQFTSREGNTAPIFTIEEDTPPSS